MDLAEIGIILQTIGVLSAATAAVIGVRSYINSNKRTEDAKKKEQETRDRELETRGAQLFMQLFDSFTNVETIKIDYELMHYQWSDYDDFYKKYGSDSNLEATAKRQSLHSRFDNIGWLLKCKIIDPEWAYNQVAAFALFHWVKFKSIILEERKRYGWQSYMENWEYMVNEFERIGKDRGFNSETVINYTEWIPDAKSNQS